MARLELPRGERALHEVPQALVIRRITKDELMSEHVHYGTHRWTAAGVPLVELSEAVGGERLRSMEIDATSAQRVTTDAARLSLQCIGAWSRSQVQGGIGFWTVAGDWRSRAAGPFGIAADRSAARSVAPARFGVLHLGAKIRALRNSFSLTL